MKNIKEMLLNVSIITFMLLTGAAQAADHMDSPATEADPSADLLDLYAFVAPLCGSGTGTTCEDEPEELWAGIIAGANEYRRAA